MQWILSYPVWTLALALIASALLSGLLYYRQKSMPEASKGLVLLLATLRFLAFFLIALLLLQPLLKYISIDEEPPIVLYVEDNSSSIKDAWNKQELAIFAKERALLRKELADAFKTHFYSFGADLVPIKLEDTLDFNQKSTSISNALEKALEEHAGKNIGAIVLSTDGLFNTGSNPLYLSSSAYIPLYTIALGDTSIKKDLLIRQIRYNDLVYLGDEFSLLADVGAYQLNGKSTAITLKDASGNVLQSETLQIDGNEWNKTREFKLKAQKPGVQKYTLSVSSLPDEVSLSNNSTNIYVQVIDGRQKLLLLYGAPHPDVRLFKEVLENNPNVELTAIHRKDFKGSNAIYDLVIWHGIPSKSTSSANTDLAKMSGQSKSNWFITTTLSDFQALNQMQKVVQFEVNNKTPNDITPKFNSSFNKFSVSNESTKWLEEVPPLVSPYGQHRIAEGADVIWTQNIGRVSTTIPLFAVGNAAQKNAVLAGEGLWRWAMQEQLRYGNQNSTAEWIEKTIQFIAVKSDQRPFRVRASKDVYAEGEAVVLDAALFNESFQLVNDTEVSLQLKGESGAGSNFVMDKTSNAYSINLGAMAPGTYTITAKANRSGKEMSTSTTFTVKEVLLESLQSSADHSLLQSMSLASGAKMYSHRNMSLLKEALLADDRITALLSERTNTRPLIDFKFVIAVIIALLSMEWFLRRFFGSY